MNKMMKEEYTRIAVMLVIMLTIYTTLATFVLSNAA